MANEDKGLGDSLARLFKHVKVDKAVKSVVGEDCGCDARKHKLNKMFPTRQPLCMTEDEYHWWTHFKTVNDTTLAPMARMQSEFGEFRVYVVEVCLGCGWNHLSASYLLGDGRDRKPPRKVKTL